MIIFVERHYEEFDCDGGHSGLYYIICIVTDSRGTRNVVMPSAMRFVKQLASKHNAKLIYQ